MCTVHRGPLSCPYGPDVGIVESSWSHVSFSFRLFSLKLDVVISGQIVAPWPVSVTVADVSALTGADATLRPRPVSAWLWHWLTVSVEDKPARNSSRIHSSCCPPPPLPRPWLRRVFQVFFMFKCMRPSLKHSSFPYNNTVRGKPRSGGDAHANQGRTDRDLSGRRFTSRLPVDNYINTGALKHYLRQERGAHV